MRVRRVSVAVALAAAVLAAAVLATTGGTATPKVGEGKASPTKSVCGLGTGKKATGAPIKLGGIAMLIPGVDFTTVGKIGAGAFWTGMVDLVGGKSAQDVATDIQKAWDAIK